MWLDERLPDGARVRLGDPFDRDAAIDVQAHHMRDLLRTFGSVPLALAAYNAGPAQVRRCMCVAAIPETQTDAPTSSGCWRAALATRASASAG